MAENRESSMREISGSQRTAMEAIKKKYEDTFKKMGGVEEVLKNFKEYLEKEYQKNPPVYKGQKLPLKHEPKLFERTPQQSAEDHTKDIKAINELYFMNPIHTAWRYFLNPNPWINPGAPYAAKNAQGVSTHADITKDAREDLAYLWLAASDTSIKPIRDMTITDMMQHFTNEIAFINRGHNWDVLDAMAEGPDKRKVTEEMIKKYGKTVDDLRPDNPSCNMGVNQRLMQSVLGNPITETPDTRALDPKIARDHVIDLVTTRFNEYLKGKEFADLKKLKGIFDKMYVEMEPLTKTEEALFNEFKLSKEDTEKVLKEMHELFGDRMSFVEIQVGPGEYCTCYEEYVRKLLSKNPYETFYERLSIILENTIKSKETKHEKEGKEHKKEMPPKKEIAATKEVAPKKVVAAHDHRVSHAKDAAHAKKTAAFPQSAVRSLIGQWETKEKESKEKKGREPRSPRGRGGGRDAR